jgi:hypothetical protein
MTLPTRVSALFYAALGVVGLAAWAAAQGTSAPRPGLSAQQTKRAVDIVRESLLEQRRKTEGAARPDIDHREYVVGVELLTTKESETKAGPAQPRPKEEPPAESPGSTTPTTGSEKTGTSDKTNSRGPLALVTSYRYFDDLTIFAIVDLGAGKVVNLEAAQHLRTALSDEEYEDAKTLARERSDEVKALYQKFGDKLSVNPQFSQFSVKDDPRIHRVIHLTYRVGTRDLSSPRPIVDLTTREVSTPAPEAFPKPRRAAR